MTLPPLENWVVQFVIMGPDGTRSVRAATFMHEADAWAFFDLCRIIGGVELVEVKGLDATTVVAESAPEHSQLPSTENPHGQECVAPE